MVHKTIRCFEEIDGVKNRLKTGRSAIATNPEKSLDVLQSFVENPQISTRRTIQEQHQIDQKSVCKILKQNIPSI